VTVGTFTPFRAGNGRGMVLRQGLGRLSISGREQGKIGRGYSEKRIVFLAGQGGNPLGTGLSLSGAKLEYYLRRTIRG